MNPSIIIAGINAMLHILDTLAAKGEVSDEKVAEIKARVAVSESKWDAAVDAAKARQG